uniref:Ubiquitin-activating enzyme E1 C-terminal domain-containing protein n=1 Tax=Romanomermis culicivorax TaxID=13658 RepID=A0A915HU58_ROMCU
MDRRCVYYRKPLLETGTLGAKGNTQVIYPFLTESYSSSQDPPEKSIPICTVKHFPNQIEHTIQWARELFTGLFANPAETVNQFVDDPRLFHKRLEKMHAGQKFDMLNVVKRFLIDEKPTSAEKCVEWARRLLDESFDWDIRQLLHNFPADQVTSNGAKFWSGTKRCPKPMKFDPNDKEQMEFIFSAASLRAQMYNLTPIDDRQLVVKIAQGVVLPVFEPKSGVHIAVNDSELQQQSSDLCDADRLQELNLCLAKLKVDKTFKLNPIDFEKDDDSNHHVDFITAASNLRAANYSIPIADKLKIVAGDGKCKLEVFKNGFIELALPFFGFAEPMKAPTKQYYDNKFTLWDRFEVDGDITLKDLFDHMITKYKLEISMLSQGVCILYSFFLDNAKRQDRMKMTLRKLVETTSGKPIPPHVKSLVLEPLCCDDKGEDVEVPYINYILPKPN